MTCPCLSFLRNLPFQKASTVSSSLVGAPRPRPHPSVPQRQTAWSCLHSAMWRPEPCPGWRVAWGAAGANPALRPNAPWTPLSRVADEAIVANVSLPFYIFQRCTWCGVQGFHGPGCETNRLTSALPFPSSPSLWNDLLLVFPSVPLP